MNTATDGLRTALVIPALDEEATIAAVVREARAQFTGEIIVVDNGSTDATAAEAERAGARVVSEPVRGYGRACMAGVAAAHEADVLVFMDGDGSCVPAQIPALLAAVAAGADLAVGVRHGAGVEAGSITPPARFGNWLSGMLFAACYGRHLRDPSPFKAVRRMLLDRLALRETTYGWTVELLACSLRAGARIEEVEVGYRRRAGGTSKVSGNLMASLRAGLRILATIGRVAVSDRSAGGTGAAVGALVAAGFLVVLAVWLAGIETASLRAGIAVWLFAWPALLLGTTAGYAAGVLLHRLRGHTRVHSEGARGCA